MAEPADTREVDRVTPSGGPVPLVEEGMTQRKASPCADAPPYEAIAVRAYAIFLNRGGSHGDDWADWLQAEAVLRGEDGQASGQPEP